MDGSPPGGCRQWRLRWRGLRCSFCEVRVPLYLVRKVGRFVHPRVPCLGWRRWCFVCPWGLVFLAGIRFAGGGFPCPVGLLGSLLGGPMRTCCWAVAARRWWLRLLFAGVVAASSRCAGDGGGFLVGGGQIRQRRGWHRRLRRRSREVCTPPP